MKRTSWIVPAAIIALAACGGGSSTTTSTLAEGTTTAEAAEAPSMTLAGLNFDVHQEPG